MVGPWLYAGLLPSEGQFSGVNYNDLHYNSVHYIGGPLDDGSDRSDGSGWVRPGYIALHVGEQGVVSWDSYLVRTETGKCKGNCDLLSVSVPLKEHVISEIPRRANRY
jgi:hypothetical protein